MTDPIRVELQSFTHPFLDSLLPDHSSDLLGRQSLFDGYPSLATLPSAVFDSLNFVLTLEFAELVPRTVSSNLLLEGSEPSLVVVESVLGCKVHLFWMEVLLCFLSMTRSPFIL